MEVVDVIQSVRVRVLRGTDSHVASFLSVRADVLPERGGFFEGAVAEGAAAGPLARVDELVVLEVLQAAQALPTDGAHVGLLPRVRAPVLAQAVQVPEAVPALGAGVRFLARVNAQVRFQRPRLAEAAAADSARIGLLSGVDADVLLQAGNQAEGLSALQTVVGTVSGGLPRSVGCRRTRGVLRSAWRAPAYRSPG